MPISSSVSYTDVAKRETKSHGSIFFPAACYNAHFPSDFIPWHWHKELELIYIHKGHIILSADSKDYLLSEGMGAFVNSDTLHTTRAQDSSQQSVVHAIVFHPRLIGGAEDSIYWQKYLLPLMQNMDFTVQTLSEKTDWQHDILSKIQMAWKDLAEDSHGYEFRVRSTLSEILLSLGDHQKQTAINLPERVKKNSQRMKQMLNFIQEHYYEAIVLDNIAASASISKSECLRCFRQVLDTTPLRYVNQYRLMVAARNLIETDWQISEIGYSCGFKEMGYFSAQFKKKYAMTPSEYRKNTFSLNRS